MSNDTAVAASAQSAEFHPLVSIVIPVYNGSNYLREAIDSALSQTYDNIEILVINDGSDDEGKTDAIARSYGDKIRYFTKENGGVATALNMGIENMRGEYFSWLSHDDVYLPEKVEKQIVHLKTASSKSSVVYSDFEYIDSNGNLLYTEKLDLKYSLNQLNLPLFALLKGNLHGCAMLIKKEVLIEFGCFDVALLTTQDYMLFYNILSKYKILYVSAVLVKSRVHELQGSFGHANALHKYEKQELWNYIINDMLNNNTNGMNEEKINLYSDLARTMKSNDLAECHAKALMKITACLPKQQNILLTTSMKSGGLYRFIKTLHDELHLTHNIFILYSDAEYLELSVKNQVIFTHHLSERIEYCCYSKHAEIVNVMVLIITVFKIDIIHMNGFINFGFKCFEIAKKLGVKVVATLHDYSWVCLSQHLLDNNHKFCNYNLDKNKCEKCNSNNSYIDSIVGKVTTEQIFDCRNYIIKCFLPTLDKFVVPNKSCVDVLRAYSNDVYLTKIDMLIIEHGINAPVITEAKNNSNDFVRVGIIGNIAWHKGCAVISDIVNSACVDSFKFYLFGSSQFKIKNITCIDKYEYDEIFDLLSYNKIDVILLLPTAPETYSYTLAESLLAGIPIIATRIGALEERIERTSAGWLVDTENTKDKVMEILEQIRSNRSILQKMKNNIKKITINNARIMASEYSKIYGSFSRDLSGVNILDGFSIFLSSVISSPLMSAKLLNDQNNSKQNFLIRAIKFYSIFGFKKTILKIISKVFQK